MTAATRAAEDGAVEANEDVLEGPAAPPPPPIPLPLRPAAAGESVRAAAAGRASLSEAAGDPMPKTPIWEVKDESEDGPAAAAALFLRLRPDIPKRAMLEIGTEIDKHA